MTGEGTDKALDVRAGATQEMLAAARVLRVFADLAGGDGALELIARAQRIESAAPHIVTARQEVLRARLAALTEMHEFFEFDAVTDEQMDEWLHERIKEVRQQLGLSAPTPAIAP